MSAEPQRLGETDAFGWELLRLLELAGWAVVVRAAFAGDGSLVIASKNGHEVRRAGSVADVGREVFREATRVQRLELDRPVQLQLVR